MIIFEYLKNRKLKINKIFVCLGHTNLSFSYLDSLAPLFPECNFLTSDRHFGCKVVLSASFLKSDNGKNYNTRKKTDKVIPTCLFVQMDINIHEKFFNFTKQFFCIQARQISLRFDLINATKIICFAIKKWSYLSPWKIGNKK